MITRLFVLLLLLASAPWGALAAEPQSDAGIKRATPVGIGDVAPDFTLTDQHGRRHTLSAELKQRPVVLVFYRGHW